MNLGAGHYQSPCCRWDGEVFGDEVFFVCHGDRVQSLQEVNQEVMRLCAVGEGFRMGSTGRVFACDQVKMMIHRFAGTLNSSPPHTGRSPIADLQNRLRKTSRDLGISIIKVIYDLPGLAFGLVDLLPLPMDLWHYNRLSLRLSLLSAWCRIN